jgi:hypothetical protein
MCALWAFSFLACAFSISQHCLIPLSAIDLDTPSYRFGMMDLVALLGGFSHNLRNLIETVRFSFYLLAINLNRSLILTAREIVGKICVVFLERFTICEIAC